MDPMKALQDLDKIVSNAPMDRKGHTHVIQCVQAISEALMKPFTEPVAGPALVADADPGR